MDRLNDPYRRYIEAALSLLGEPGGLPGSDAFRIVCGGEIREQAETAGLLSMTLETTGGLLYLEMPEHGVWLGPQRLIVFRRAPHGSESRFDVQGDCAFWAADDHGPLLVVSRAGARYFELGTAGLLERDGLPASDAREGFERATGRLRAAAGAIDADHQPRELAKMIEDDDLDPQFRLEVLAGSDPEARASMMRHTVALRSMLTGRLHDREVDGLLIGADFKTTPEDVDRIRDLTGADGNSRVMVGFDVDDPCGPPASFGLWHAGGVPTFYDRCAPWLPPTGNRALLVGINDVETAHLRFQRGCLVRKAGLPSRDPRPGLERAKARLATLVATPAVRNAVGDVHIRIAIGSKPAIMTLPTGPLSDLG